MSKRGGGGGGAREAHFEFFTMSFPFQSVSASDDRIAIMINQERRATCHELVSKKPFLLSMLLRCVAVSCAAFQASVLIR